MKNYAVHAAPTFGRSFVGSLAFLHHVLGSKTSLSCVESRRVSGCASKLFLNKRALKQREPLRVEHVRMLESVCLGEHRMGLQERILSGFCLFMIDARARHSDAQSAADIHLDVAEVDGAINGYVEARVRRSKTSFSLERKTRFLPMVAPIQGVCDDAWALSWMKCMDDAGIERGQEPLASGKWSKIPLNAEMTAAWMNFSGTDESVLLGFARVSERMWVAPPFGSFACSYAWRFRRFPWKVSLSLKVPSPLRLRNLCFQTAVLQVFPWNIFHFAMHLVWNTHVHRVHLTHPFWFLHSLSVLD